MANSLGVKIKIDYSEVDKLQTKLDSLIKDRNIEVKLSATKALNKLTSFEEKYDALRSKLNSGLDLKISNISSVEKIFDNLVQSGKQVNATLENTSNTTREMANGLQETDSLYKKITESTKILADGTARTQTSIEKSNGSLNKQTDTYIDGAIQARKVTEDRSAALKEISAKVKEIGNLERSQIGNDDKSNAAIQKRIDLLKQEKEQLTTNYFKQTGQNPYMDKDLMNLDSLETYKTSLKQISQEKAQQNQLDKETQGLVDQIVKMENEKYSLLTKASTAGEQEKSVILDRVRALQNEQLTLAKGKDLYANMSTQQRESLDTLSRQNALQLEYTNNLRSASDADRAKVQAQKATFSELKSDLKEIESLQSKITELQAQENNNSISGKDSQRLASLKEELELRDQNYESSKKIATADGKLSTQQGEYLDKIKQATNAKQEEAEKTAKINADLNKSKQLYSELESSIKTVAKLKDQQETAGSKEKSILQDVIALEEKKQAVIQETLSKEGLKNTKREDEVSDLKEQLSLQNQIKAAKRQDRPTSTSGQEQNIGILGDLLNPRAMFNDVKQAAMTIYDSVSTIDSAMVNVAKVVDAPQSELEEFSRTIYDTASQVGKSADEYAVSVERWASAGKTLQESIELSNVSVMGSFVGNIDEAAMVDYMSIPLNAYKDSALEAEDVINAMNEVANKNAIEMDDLGKAYSKAASTSAQAGTSFSELTGIINAGQEATRAGGETVGSAIKSMDTNFGKMSTLNTAMDEKKFNFFKDIGVNIKDSNGELRSTYDILQDLSGVWGELSKEDRSNAGFYAAGKQYGNVFAGILSNWDKVTKAEQEASEQLGLIDKTTGSAFKEFEVQQDSIEFKAANLKNSWAEFLNTVAGGKDGVTVVMAALNDGLQKATELAKNDTFMGIAKGIGKIIGAMTGVTIMEKFFNTITKGSLGAFKGLGKLAKVGAHSKTPKLLTGILGVGGKIIPVIGGITLALVALDAVGVPVFDTIKKGFEKIKEVIKPAKKELDDYADKQEKLNKKLDNNKILNGEIESNNQVIKSYQELRKQKEKTFKETGDESARSYSDEEFTKIRDDFNTTAEGLGMNIRITMNDYDDIEKKYQQLIEYNNALSGAEAGELTKDLDEKSKYDKNDSKREQNEKDVFKERTNNLRKYLQENTQLTEDEQLKAAQAMNDYQDAFIGQEKGFFNSDYMKKAEDENRDRINQLNKTRNDLVNAANAGTLNQGFKNGDVKTEDQKSTIAMLSSQLPILKQQSSMYDSIKKSINDGTKLLPEQKKYLESLNGDYSTIEMQTSKWDDNMKNGVLDTLKEGSGKSKEQTDKLVASMKQLGETAGLSKGEIDKMVSAASKGGTDFIDLMSEYGDMGASLVGITNTMMEYASANDIEWSDMAKNIQSQLDGMDDEVVIRYKLEQDNGLANFDMLDEITKLPDSLVTHFKVIDDTGNIDIANTVEMLNKINEISGDKELMAKFGIETDQDGVVQLNNFMDSWEKLDTGQQDDLLFNLGVTVDDMEFNDKTGKIEKKKQDLDDQEVKIELTAEDMATDILNQVIKNATTLGDEKYSAYLTANPDSANITIAQVQTKLGAYNTMDYSARLDADNQGALTAYAEAHGMTVTFDSETGEATFKGENSDAINKATEAMNKLGDFDGKEGHATLTADSSQAKSSIQSAIDKLAGFTDKKIKLTTIKETINNVINKVTGKSGSVGIGINPQLGSSFSASVGSQLVGQSKNTAIGKSQSTRSSSSTNSDARVNEDVWRYWAKELYKGMPLDNSMDDLKRSIDNANDDQNKLISLYKKQNDLLNKQIAYNKDLKNAQQSEMNSILSQLRKQGFRTSGNQITNLSHAQSFKGDKASDVDKLLSDYNSLYKSINDLNGTIKDLQQQQNEIKESIKQANIAKEAKAIESSLKKSEAILKSIDNANSIQSTKEGLVKDQDYEFSASIKEQGMNTASANMGKLVDEYNRLAKSTVNYEENAGDVQSQLEDLKSSILENADAILDYREQLDSIRIDRLINDYSKFNDVMNRNIDAVSNNIDNLKDGLISGTNLSDLMSSDFSNLDLTRKSKYQKEQEDRIKLEAELDAALDGFAKKNVDRTQKVANDILQIEKNKYNSLLGMANDYSNGKAITTNTSTSNSVDFGIMGAVENDKAYSEWKKRLNKVNQDYKDSYAKMVSSYDKAMAGASGQNKENLTNKMIIDQLKLQEKMQQSLIDLNKEKIKQAEKELENTSLTTEQREQLISAIEEYKQSSTDAQNKIKESISSRYEFEFDLMDKQADKVKKYTENLSYLLDVANLVGTSSKGKQSIYDAIYQAKINEYSNAKKSLKSLEDEQAKFAEGSYEWELLQEKIDEVNKSLQEFTVDALNANKDVLGNALDTAQESLEKGIFGGKSLDDWKDYQDNWVDGISKEIELDSLRKRLLDLEDDNLNKRLEALDRQEAVSQVNLDYLDKQAKILELQKKLQNLEKERNVQTLVRGDDGTWAWQYVADQTEYDKTKEELDQAKQDLDKYQKDQRTQYASALNDVIDRAKNGEYESSADIQKDIDKLNAIYGNVIGDMPDIDTSSIAAIIAAYDQYVKDNGLIVDSAIEGNQLSTETLEGLGAQFETSFRNISEDLGAIIGNEMRKALMDLSESTGFNSYNVQIGSLEFPNVQDVTGMEEFFRDLPSTVEQLVYKK